MDGSFVKIFPHQIFALYSNSESQFTDASLYLYCYCLQHRLTSVKLLEQKMSAEIPMESVLLDDSTKFITLAAHINLCPHYLVRPSV